MVTIVSVKSLITSCKSLYYMVTLVLTKSTLWSLLVLHGDPGISKTLLDYILYESELHGDPGVGKSTF